MGPEFIVPPGSSFEEKLGGLPEGPGVYLYKDRRGRVLYVGKAKSLKSRVRSYFQRGAAHPPKTAALLAEVRDLELILTGSEREALILENNLIKKERPRYNVLLRDDKNFPYLKMTVRPLFWPLPSRRQRPQGPSLGGEILPGRHLP
ncbi:MAG: hypothetical protein DMH00_08500 [Acidobacteria bacterium]|nr:MAG: hypothetical protein DMH00_08500 [Acidobacteriota bacterium]